MTTTVYLVGTNEELNQGRISLYGGKVLVAFPNYTRVLRQRPVDLRRDQFVYGLNVPDEKVRPDPSNPSDESTALLWDGPDGGPQYPGYMVQTEIVILSKEPQEDPAVLRQVNEDLMQRIADLSDEIRILREKPSHG